jgi:hypothetical protein
MDFARDRQDGNKNETRKGHRNRHSAYRRFQPRAERRLNPTSGTLEMPDKKYTNTVDTLECNTPKSDADQKAPLKIDTTGGNN